ncbi:MAG: 2-oxo acid dehydrogenase subunit E2 [Anaerolineaceae bacterium]|nr:2-oxo acid dehydrogenase subunit E2 [Anaerolineaceae bacterium]
MATEFYIPKLGQTVEEVTIIGWLVEDGVKIRRGDELIEVETDKAVFPVEANGKGFLHKGPFKAGDVVPVLTVVGIIGAEDEVFKASTETNEAPEETKTDIGEIETNAIEEINVVEIEKGRIVASPRARKAARENSVNLAKIKATGENGFRIVEKDVLDYVTGLPKITPVARKLAEQKGVDWEMLTGSGTSGKITKDDIQAALFAKGKSIFIMTTPTGVAQGVESVRVPLPLPDVEISERIALSGVRKIIAERMAASAQTTAGVTLMMEVNAAEFVRARNHLKNNFTKSWGFAPGYNDLLAKIVSQALRKYPYMNARITPDAVEQLANVNVAMAVDTERGLMVPVINNSDRKSLQEFGSEFREKVDRARAGRSLPDDLSGGTFTITNLGMYDVEAFTPVINLPEAAILGVGKIIRKPVVVEGEIVVRDMWTLSLVFDHRLVDGAPAARFLQYIKQVIENPFMLLV